MINAIKDLYHRWLANSSSIHQELTALKAENALLEAYLCMEDPTASICQ